MHISSIDLVKNLLLPNEKWYPELQHVEFKKQLDEIKRSVTTLDWDGITKNDHWRGKMSELKLKLIEEFPTLINGWVLLQVRELKEPYVLFVDIREPENISSFERFCESNSNAVIKTILVESIRSIKSPNRSDESIYRMQYDFTIKNDGNIKDLGVTVKSFIETAILNDFGRREIRN